MEAASSKKASPLSSPKVAFNSPTFRSRLEEKEELQNLNDRFAVYIDKMRSLEERNTVLTAEITSFKEKEKQQVSEVKGLYEEELTNARRLLDEIYKEKSRVEVENARNSSLVIDLQEKLALEQEALKTMHERNSMLERKANETDALLIGMKMEHKNLKENHERVLKDHKKMQAVVDSTSQKLEERTIEKVDLENRIEMLTKDLDFRKRSYEQELTEINEKISSADSSRIVMETDFQEKYDSVMKDKLQELRDQFEEEAENIRQDVENSYKLKLDDLQKNREKLRGECNSQLVIMRDLKSSIDTLKMEKSILETDITSMRKRIENIEQLHASEKDDLARALQEKSDEIEKLNGTIDDSHKEYEELMGIKVALDLEINAYRKLLEGEEERLNITPTVTPSRKRRRTESDLTELPVLSTAKGNVRIAECDPNGLFISISNTGSMEEPLGGWILRCVSDGNDPVEFKFSPRSVLKGEAKVSIWSASSGTKHKPPTDLVMKSYDWGKGLNSIITLHNSEGDVVAQMTQTSLTELGSRSRTRRKRQDAKNESCIIA